MARQNRGDLGSNLLCRLLQWFGKLGLVMGVMLRLGLTIVVGFFLVSTACGSQGLKSLPKAQRIFVIVCEGVELRDLEQMDEPISTLLRESAIGLLSGASAELAGGKGVLVTLGSGKRAKANERAKLGEWLSQGNVSVALHGNGFLKAILGEVRASPNPNRTPQVIFVSATKSQLPTVARELLVQLTEEACLWILVPNSSRTDWMNRRLTPILVFGKNVPSGLLTSTTTRRIGLVSSVDFAPTLLAQLSIPIPAEVTGRVMQIDTSVNDRLAYLHWLDERSVKPLQDLPALSFAITIVVVIAVALTALASAFSLLVGRQGLSNLVSPAANFFVISGMSIPASLFLVAQLPHRSNVASAFQMLATVSLLGLLALLLVKKLSATPFPTSLKAAGLICAFSAIVALFGVPLYWATPLGHYPTSGWRYFGITNSGVGIVLAGTIFAWSLLALPKRFVSVWLLASPLLMGFSLWGANFGGALTLAIGFAAAWELIGNPKPSWGKVAALSLAASVLTLFALIIAESFVPADQQAHLGALIQRVRSVGGGALVEMVLRKLTLLWEFFARTPLNFFALSVFAAFQIAAAKLAKQSNLFAQLKPTFDAVFIGSLAGLVLNDSGMEVVGMALVCFGGVFFLSLLETFRSPVRGDRSAVRASP
jgi:hypothetical protein